MKVSINIFTLYLLMLSLIPCGDNGGGIIEIVNHLFGIEHQEHPEHQHDSNSCGEDDCTPFCVCNCCSTVLHSPENLVLPFNPFPPTPNKLPAFAPNLIFSIFTMPVWQPPTA
ncbi:MAG: hypothetical protein KDC34_14095 [Saprospiraceae bacterium]|nr:hypothetical protein [Saprospiraceae bacterium]